MFAVLQKTQMHFMVKKADLSEEKNHGRFLCCYGLGPVCFLSLSSVSISIIPCPSVKFTCFGMSRDSLSACYFLFYFDSP